MARKGKNIEATVARIREMADEFFSMSQVGKELGFTRSKVAGIARLHKIKFKSLEKKLGKKDPQPKKTRVAKTPTGVKNAKIRQDPPVGTKLLSPPIKTPPKKKSIGMLQTVQMETCQWPEEKIGRDYKRCGKPAVMKKPDYCKEHSEKAYKPSSEKARGLFRLSQHYK